MEQFGVKMMQIVRRDICTATESMILQGCNAQGVMGSGVAKAIRLKWPGVFSVYRLEYERGLLVPGHVTIAVVENFAENRKFIANIITQKTFGYDGSKYARYSALVKGLETVRSVCLLQDITEVATPPIGCGLGGLNKDFVFELLEEGLTEHGINVTIYEI